MALAALAAAAVGSTVYSIYSGEKARGAQKDAMEQAKQANAQTQAAADQALNRANPAKPNTAANMSALQQQAKGGPSGTMLTGPTGVDPSTLSLGKSTLLGS